jgi:hypothetical protein
MKKQISFVTGLFDPGVTKQAETGDRLLGHDLADWLVSKAEHDEFDFATPIQDAHGWSVLVGGGGEKFKLGFEIIQSSVGDDHAEWRITIDKLRKWKMLGSSNSQTRGRLCDLIHNVLREEGEIREVQWTE